MSQCYTVWGTLCFKEKDPAEFVKNLRNAIEEAPLCEKCDTTKTDPAYYIRFLTNRNASVEMDEYDRFRFIAEFNATYSYKSVLIDIFEKAVKCLDCGSFIEIVGDDWEERREIRPDDLASKIAVYITEDGCMNTTNGSWCVYYDEIAEEFGITEEEVSECADEVVKILNYDVCAECECNDNCFDLMFFLFYCGIEEDDEE